MLKFKPLSLIRLWVFLNFLIDELWGYRGIHRRRVGLPDESLVIVLAVMIFVGIIEGLCLGIAG